MAMPTSKMYVSGVELSRMGQHLTLARYPIHWHLVGDAKGQYIRNSAIHDTFNRCVTVHGTNHLQVENNVNAKPVYFPPMERKWGSDNGSSAAWKSAVFRDKDGSVSGVPDSFILMNDGVHNAIAIDEQACEIKPAWNAAVCKGDIGRVGVGGAPGGGAAQPPVHLSRNGKVLTVTGEINVRAGTEIKVTTERPSVSLNVREMDSGSWVIFELPGFTTAATGSPQNSLKALRKADTTSYYKSKSSLWVKVVSTGDVGSGPRGGTSLQVSR